MDFALHNIPQAIFHGFSLCFFNQNIRRLAVWPWLIGAFSAVFCFWGAFRLHPFLVAKVITTPEGWWEQFLYVLIYLGIGLILVCGVAISSLLLVTVFAGFFQSLIAHAVFRDSPFAIPVEGSGVSNTAREIGRTVSVEIVKLLWILPLMVVLFFIGIIPIFAPIAFILTAWLLAYQFIDVALDLHKLRVGTRLRFALKHWIPFSLFGMCFLALFFIPIVNLLIPPIAVASATWLLGKTTWGEKELQLLLRETK